MRLLVDMNLAPRWAEFLRSADMEAVHWSELGNGDASDIEIMTYARTHDFVVLTHDLDFGAILAATNGEKPSVIQIRAGDPSPDAVGRQVLTAIKLMAADIHDGALVTIEPSRSRVRLLPLRSDG